MNYTSPRSGSLRCACAHGLRWLSIAAVLAFATSVVAHPGHHGHPHPAGHSDGHSQPLVDALEDQPVSHPAPESDADGYRWWKGNLHTHSLWSDGDQFPEVIVDWYQRNGYHFLALSDHNVLLRGERWIDPETNAYARRAGGREVYEIYRNRFGDHGVDTRDREGRLEVRLKPLDEFRHLKFFEVYNGHRGVANLGDATHVDLDRMWDIVLTRRLAEEDLGLVYALAVDDAHHYESSGNDVARPGRGWVMIRSRFLTPAHLFGAMEQGDFYASIGVELERITHDDRGLTVAVRTQPGENDTIQFIGTRRGYDRSRDWIRDSDGNAMPVTMRYSDEIGRVLQTVHGPLATYSFDGDERYVRARILSSRLKENPFVEGEREQAWTQPIRPAWLP